MPAPGVPRRRCPAPERIRDLAESDEHGLLVVGGARVHRVDGGALLGAQGAAVEDRRDEPARQCRRRCPSLSNSAPNSDRLLTGRAGEIDVRVEIGFRHADRGGAACSCASAARMSGRRRASSEGRLTGSCSGNSSCAISNSGARIGWRGPVIDASAWRATSTAGAAAAAASVARELGLRADDVQARHRAGVECHLHQLQVLAIALEQDSTVAICARSDAMRAPESRLCR